MSAEPVAPQNLTAEESVIGAIMLAGAGGAEVSSHTLAAIHATGLTAEDFYRESHGLIYAAALDLVERGKPSDVLGIESELRKRRELTKAGGAKRLQELAGIVPAISNASHFAELVVEAAMRREQAAVAIALRSAAENGGGIDADLRERLARVIEVRRSDAAMLGLSHADVLALDVPATVELIEGMIEAGTVGTIAALPETFKSWLASEIVHKIAGGGGSVLGRRVLRQGPVGYWWQDDSRENEIRRIQAYAARNGYSDPLPIRWHLNEGLQLPDHLPRLREQIEREQQVIAFLDSLYNFVPGIALKDEEIAAIYAAIKHEVCDQTGASVAVVDHSPWPSEGNRGQRRAYGSVFKAAAIRWGIYLAIEADTIYIEARGNNVTGLPRTPVTFDTDRLELRVLEAPSQEVDLDARIDDFLRRNPGAATSVVKAAVQGNATAIAQRLRDSERFVSVPPVLFGKPRNAICWTRAEDAQSLLSATYSRGEEHVGNTLPRDTDNNVFPPTYPSVGGGLEEHVGVSPSPQSGDTLEHDAGDAGRSDEK